MPEAPQQPTDTLFLGGLDGRVTRKLLLELCWTRRQQSARVKLDRGHRCREPSRRSADPAVLGMQRTCARCKCTPEELAVNLTSLPHLQLQADGGLPRAPSGAEGRVRDAHAPAGIPRRASGGFLQALASRLRRLPSSARGGSGAGNDGAPVPQCLKAVAARHC